MSTKPLNNVRAALKSHRLPIGADARQRLKFDARIYGLQAAHAMILGDDVVCGAADAYYLRSSILEARREKPKVGEWRCASLSGESYYPQQHGSAGIHSDHCIVYRSTGWSRDHRKVERRGNSRPSKAKEAMELLDSIRREQPFNAGSNLNDARRSLTKYIRGNGGGNGELRVGDRRKKS